MFSGNAQKLQMYAIGPLRLIPDLGLLLRDGKKIDIPQKPFEILVTLARADGRALSKDEILESVWRDQEVEENCLQGHMTVLRKTLGSDRAAIKTEFGFGYRLSARKVDIDETVSPSRFAPLPIPRSSFIGRKEESGTIASLLRKASIVTVTGTGGIGKSRLALEIATSLQGSFRDGVCLIELAPVSDKSLVLQTIGSALHLDLDIERIAEVRARDWNALIVLDNCEHVLDDVCEAMKIVSKQIPQAKFLCASQEPLGISGEQVFRLHPLPSPTEDFSILSNVLLYPATELLVARIAAADQQSALTDADAPNLCRVCRQLDGIPLAIELAAARVPLLGLSTVLTGLSDRFRLLSGGRGADLPRHRTLKATLEWSFGLLTVSERTCLSRLSIFADLFTVAAADFVVAWNEDNRDIHELMASLVSKSLVSVERPEGEARFRISESMRLFLFERFVAESEFSAVAARHAQFFQSRLAAAANDWRTLSSDVWTERYRSDLGDVRAALDWTFSNEADHGHAAAVLCTSLPFWTQLSLLDECGRRVADTLDRLKVSRALKPQLEMQLIAAVGASATWVEGPTPKAKTSWSRALVLAEQVNDDEFRLQAHYGLWLYHLRAGDFVSSLKSAEAMASLAKSRDDTQAMYAGQRATGVTLHFLGQHDRGGAIIDELLAASYHSREFLPFRFAVDQRTAALAYRSRIHWIQGDEKTAISMALTGVDEARGLGHGSSLCCSFLEGICTVAALARRPDMLEPYAEEALRLAERYNLGFWARYAKAFLALSATFLKKTPETIGNLHAAVTTLDKINLHSGYPYFCLALAEIEAQAKLGRRIGLFIDRMGETPHWAKPEAMRIHCALMSPELRQKRLREAKRAAESAGAVAWVSRIRSDLTSQTKATRSINQSI